MLVFCVLWRLLRTIACVPEEAPLMTSPAEELSAFSGLLRFMSLTIPLDAAWIFEGVPRELQKLPEEALEQGLGS